MRGWSLRPPFIPQTAGDGSHMVLYQVKGQAKYWQGGAGPEYLSSFRKSFHLQLAIPFLL